MESRDQVITGIRACLISTKGGVAEKILNNDYKNLMGEPIPFKGLGYTTLSEFLRSIKSLKFSKGMGGETFVEAIPDNKTGHISDLVSRQKSTSKRSKGRSRTYRGGLPPRLSRPYPSARPSSLPNYQPTRQLRIPAQSRLQISNYQPAPTPRAPPPPRYGNPPIVPQRQPLETIPSPQPQKQLCSKEVLPPVKSEQFAPSKSSSQLRSDSSSKSSVQSRLDMTNLEISAPARRLDTDRIQRSVQQAQEHSNSPQTPVDITSNAAEDNEKVPPAHFIENEEEDVEFVDIQWLNKRTYLPIPSKSITLMPVETAYKMPASTNHSSIEKPKPPQARVQPKVVFKCFVDEVIALAQEMRLPEPVFKTKVRRPTNEPPVYTAQVSIGNELKLTSFPEERTTPEEATEFVAKIALSELNKKKELRKSSVLSQHLSDSIIQEQIKKIVEPHPSGIFASSVYEKYSENYKQLLPENWLDIIKAFTELTVEDNVYSVLIYPAPQVQSPQPSIPKPLAQPSIPKPLAQPSIPKPLAQPSIPKPLAQPSIPKQLAQPSISKPLAQPSSPREPPQQSSTEVSSLSPSQRSSPSPPSSLQTSYPTSNGILKPTNNTPPKLVLPDDDNWEVSVTNISGAREIWVRLIGDNYDGYYEQVMTDMEMKLIDGGVQVLNPELDSYYVVDLDNCWLRVKLLQITPASEAPDGVDTAEIFLIDNGEEDSVPVTKLCRLDPEFSCLPAQAVKCRLAFTEMLTDDSDVMPVLEDMVGYSFVAKVLQRPTDDTAAKVILYDTNSDIAVDMNQRINEKAISKLQQPKLDQKGIISSEVILTDVSEGRPLSIQVRNNELEYLENILEELSAYDLIAVHGVSAYPSLTQLNSPNSTQFLARSSQAPGKWRRGVFAAPTSNHRQIEVLFVDYGYTESVNISNLLVLEKAYPPLCKFPKQAIQVQLASVPLAQLVPGVVARLRELAPVNLPLIGKVTEVGSGAQLPTVELFKRVPPENMIASINTDLVFNMEKYSNSSVETTKKMSVGDAAKPREKGSPKLFKGLAPPTVPEIGEEYFDVHVTMASNPYNFIVQPLQDLRARNAMMEEMQTLYNDQHKVMPIPSHEELVEGSLFAAFHQQDMHWYRVSINTPLSQTQVSVHFCDFGDMSVMSVDKLRHLEPRFLRLPYQAIKAKLSGIKPKDLDWTVDDCLRFQELVVEQELISQVMEKGPDILSPQDSVIGLRLIDTHDPHKDIFIDELLINEGRAVRA